MFGESKYSAEEKLKIVGSVCRERSVYVKLDGEQKQTTKQLLSSILQQVEV